MSNIQTGAERMPHDLSHLGFLAGQIGRLITISTTPVIAGDSFEMDAVGALRLSPLRRVFAIDSTLELLTFFVSLCYVLCVSTTPVIAGDSFEMDAVGALRLSPLRRGLAIDSTVDIFTFYVPHRHVYGEQWIKFMKDGVNATPLPTVNTTGYIDHAAFLG